MRDLLRAMFGEMSPWGKFWLYLGLAALGAAAWMSFAVGFKMTPAHAIFMAILTVIAAFLPEAAYRAWNERKRGAAIAMSLAALPLFAVEFGQHAAYTAGIRGHDIATARVQNTRYDGAQETVAENKRLLAMYETRLEKLEGANQWAATVNADGLKARMTGLNLAIEQEAARGGCKAKCLERTKERDDLASRIAIAEERGKLAAMIEATKSALMNVRERAATVEHKSSQTEHMNAFLSKAVAFVSAGELEPNAHTEQGTQLSANLAIAAAGTGLPALALFVAGLYRRPEDEIIVRRTSQDVPARAKPQPQLVSVDDTSWARAILDANRKTAAA